MLTKLKVNNIFFYNRRSKLKSGQVCLFLFKYGKDFANDFRQISVFLVQLVVG